MTNQIIITEWALDSFLDLLKQNVIVTDRNDRNFNYDVLRKDVLLLKKYNLSGQSTKFRNRKFWQHFSGVAKDLYEMKWHNFGHTRGAILF